MIYALLFLLNTVCLVENTNFIVFGLSQLGFEPTIPRTRGEHANHYTNDGVICWNKELDQLKKDYY